MKSGITKTELLSNQSKAYILAALVLVTLISCAAPTLIIRETSSPKRPGWIESPQRGEETLYFVGIKTSAETLEEGRNAAIQDAMSKIGDFLGSKIESQFEEYLSDVEERLMHQIKSKSSATVKGAQVVDSYHEKMVRMDKNFRIEKYDVYVLVSFSKSEIEREIERRRRIKEETLKTAYDYYEKGVSRERERSYYEAQRYYNHALSLLESLDEVIINTEDQDIQKNDKLRLNLQASLKRVTSFLSRIELSIEISGPPNGEQIFTSSLISELNKHGFTITDRLPAIRITGKVYVWESSYAMNNYFFYAQGSLSAQRTSDRQIVAHYPFKVKGVHRFKKQAALNALAEAGLKAGEELSEMIFKKERDAGSGY